MRVRNKRYGDYGVTDEEKDKIILFCRCATKKDQEIIRWALQELDPYIADILFVSLTKGLSYERLGYVAMSKSDFYGYRRKGIEAIKRYMILSGIM